MLGKFSPHTSWISDSRQILTGFVYCLALAIALYYLYDLAACYESEVYWLGAATVNSIIAAIVIYVHRKELFSASSNLSKKYAFLDYTPLLIGAVCLALAVTSYAMGHSQQLALHWEDWLWVIWIPLVEELTFRVGFGEYFRRKLGRWWGSYFSVLLFCLAHTMGAFFYEPLKWFTAIPLGVLLLGITCEFLYVTRRKLTTIVLLHMTANFSVILFKWVDSRWLIWLNMFYST